MIADAGVLAHNDDKACLFRGDCREILRSWPDSCVDTVVTDPPYHLTQQPPSAAARSRAAPRRKGIWGESWDGGEIAFDPDLWREVLRVAKPGAMLLAFGGTRTFHRLAFALESAGWIIRDCLMWLHGCGFPKSLDIAKAIERERAGPSKRSDPNAPKDEASRWQGWGTALKPAWEPIIMAMKPLDGTYAGNARLHGVAGLHVQAGRVGNDRVVLQRYTSQRGKAYYPKPGDPGSSRAGEPYTSVESRGRWPANLILSHADGCESREAGRSPGQGRSAANRADKGRQHWVCVADCPVGLLDQGRDKPVSRFFYCAKVRRQERAASLPVCNTHPTMKPLALMEYLCKLTATPAGGVVLDPFAGSGSTLVACKRIGRPSIGIEKDPEYCRIASARLTATNPKNVKGGSPSNCET